MSKNRSVSIPTSESAAGIAIIRVALLAGLLGGLARTWADPDLWGHVQFGLDMLRTNALSRTDSYSFTTDVPWVNHEWLAEALMAVAFRVAGGAGLVLLKMLAIASTLWFVHAAIRTRLTGSGHDLVLFAVGTGLWARVFVVRPQLFSVVLFAALLSTLLSAEHGRTRRLWILPVVFAAWVNLHGGWIVGLGVFGLWSAWALMPFRSATFQSRSVLAPALATLAATLLNPYGLELWTFLFATVRVDRPSINDWRPLLDTNAQVILPWCLTVGVAAVALARGRRRISPIHAIIALALGAASLRVNRLDVFFTLSVAVLLGPYLQANRASSLLPVAWTRRTIAAACIVLVVGVTLVWRSRADLGCVRLDGPWMPEREAGVLVASSVRGRMLTWFDWGQYVIWHANSRVLVSMDGRRETVYSDAFVARHLALYFRPETSTALLDTLQPDLAWLPADLPLTQVLDQRGWHRLFTGPVSVVFARQPSPLPSIAALPADACFPGP